jgi:hypothetical protein
MSVLAAIRCRDDGADRAQVMAAPAPAIVRRYPHGDAVLLAAPILAKEGPLATLGDLRATLLALAGERPVAVELAYEEDLGDAVIVAAKQHLHERPPQRPRLWVSFWGTDSAEHALAMLELCGHDRGTRVGSAVLVDPAPDRKRLAVLAYRRGGYVTSLDGERVELGAQLWYEPPPRQKGAKAPPPPEVDVVRLEAELRAALPKEAELSVRVPDRPWRPGPDVTITTAEPSRAFAIVRAQAESIGARVSPWIRDRDPIGSSLRRLLDAV